MANIFHSEKGEDDECAYHTSLEKKMKEILSPFQEYIRSQATASIFLFICTVIALVWASVPIISGAYQKFVMTPFGFHFSHFVLSEPLYFWVNDVLLTLFFFFVGLEIKREFLVGELVDPKRAVFVLFASIGGMCVPALIYFLCNIHTLNAGAWGIPMATDTAFALGVLSCFRKNIPKGVFTFLAALAIIDDIGSIFYIAIFNTDGLNFWLLAIAFMFAIFLGLLNYAGIRKPLPYIFFGLFIWGFIEFSGVHGTLAGVIVAFLIPARPQKGPRQFIQKLKTLLKFFEERKKETPLVLKDEVQHATLEKMQEAVLQATTPLQRWESRLELPIALLILPLFALVNAGVPMNYHLLGDVFTHRVSLGILLGLVLGKPLGVILFGWVVYWCRLGAWPRGVRFSQIAGASVLTGIGFTMSLFIANLSFDSEYLLLLSKAAILLSSGIAGFFGICLMVKMCSAQDTF